MDAVKEPTAIVQQVIVPKPFSESERVADMLFHAIRRTRHEGKRVADGVLCQAMVEWFDGYVAGLSAEDREEYEANERMHTLLKGEENTETNIIIRELKAAAIEAREEIEYWHSSYLTVDKENGWKRVDQKLKAAIEAAG